MMRRQQDQQSKVFYELSALILNLLRNPTSPIDFSDDPVLSAPATAASTSAAAGGGGGGRRQMMGLQQLTPAGFASLMLGISMALMVCGSLSFFIGFMLMPWVLGLVMVFYVVGVFSSLSILGRNFLSHTPSTPSSPTKDCSSWKVL